MYIYCCTSPLLYSFLAYVVLNYSRIVLKCKYTSHLIFICFLVIHIEKGSQISLPPPEKERGRKGERPLTSDSLTLLIHVPFLPYLYTVTITYRNSDIRKIIFIAFFFFYSVYIVTFFDYYLCNSN